MLFPSSRSEDVALAAADPSLLPLLNQYGVLPRHPSQLYELLLEGVVLFIILNLFIRKPRPMGAVSGLFLIGYGAFRIIVEAFRQPDAQLGLFDGVISMGADPVHPDGGGRCYYDDLGVPSSPAATTVVRDK